MHSVLPVRKLIYEIARNLDKSVGQTVFCCVKYITKRAEFKRYVMDCQKKKVHIIATMDQINIL